jgi:hypothetical protein
MKTNEKELTAHQSMEIIHSMIATAKNNLSDDGFHFLLWGVLVIMASLAQYYLAVVVEIQYNFLPWMVMPAVGIPAAFIYEWQKKKTEKVKTLFDRVFSLLWLAIGVGMFLLIYISVSNHIPPVPFIMAIVGVGTFVSGAILRFNMLVLGGVVFWLGAFACTLTTPLNQLLINAIATFIGYIVPGVMLWKEYKKENNV